MTAREYLKQIVYLDCKIAEKRERIRELKEGAVNRSSNLSTDKVFSGSGKDKVGNAVINYTSLEAEIRADIIKRDKIVQSINLLSPYEATVIYKRYVSDKSLKEIAREMKKSYSWVSKVHIEGLEGMQKLIDEKKVGV